MIELIAESWRQLLLFLFSGGLVSLLTIYAQSRREKRDYTDGRVDKVKVEVDELRAEVKVLTDELHAKDKELGNLMVLLSAGFNLDPKKITIDVLSAIIRSNIHRLEALRAFVRVFPALIWIKRLTADGRMIMVQCSEVFAQKYVGKPASYYSGRYDSEIFGKEAAEIYLKNDLKALENPDDMPITEPADSPMTGVRGTVMVWKIGFRGGGDQYVFGFATHINPDGSQDGTHSLAIY